MPFKLGWPELIIVLVIMVLVFGVGRIGKISGELGNAIRQFRDGLGSDKDKDKKPEAGGEPSEEQKS